MSGAIATTLYNVASGTAQWTFDSAVTAFKFLQAAQEAGQTVAHPSALRGATPMAGIYFGIDGIAGVSVGGLTLLLIVAMCVFCPTWRGAALGTLAAILCCGRAGVGGGAPYSAAP